jgi:two-component system CitB family sensor kinase
VVSLIELGRAEEALRFATTELSVAQHMIDLVAANIGEPEVAALVLGKAAEANERGVNLVVDQDIELPTGTADPRDLVTIVGNLLDNAIDAAVAGTPPRWVRIAAHVDGQDFELSVADSGPGLDPDQIPQAFERGWSTKPKDRLHGRGLGLALVAQAVHRYGGTIDVTKDRGAVFTVRLPQSADQLTSAAVSGRR